MSNQNIKKEAQNIVDFFEYTSDLKEEMRLTWLPSGRNESSAEHSWNLALCAMLIAPKIKKKLNKEKVIRMCLVHDLAEVEAGDLPTCMYLGSDVDTSGYEEKERAAISNMQKKFGKSFSKEVVELWTEFEDQKTDEAKFVRFLDKFEGRVQKGLQKKEITDKENNIEFVEKYREFMKELSFNDELLLELTEIVHRKRLAIQK